ncbi:hypothetical protein CRG98_050192 [Punica granatum]|uniref:Uncharacterized protein n=1 Tax=Punica granatum TaxID=22663 RepID=A0A2I0GLL0_PUNGR|nr:hypothetical protein CRG98_050192 [Punica granatum]
MHHVRLDQVISNACDRSRVIPLFEETLDASVIRPCCPDHLVQVIVIILTAEQPRTDSHWNSFRHYHQNPTKESCFSTPANGWLSTRTIVIATDLDLMFVRQEGIGRP